MRIRAFHTTVYRYEPPATGVIQSLRLTPRNHDGQHVLRWRIDVSADARLNAHEDAFGNITHAFSADGPFNELSVQVEGEVETQNTDGVVRGAIERFPPSLFLRETPLTQADDAIRSYAQDVIGDAPPDADTLNRLHALLQRLHADIVYDTTPTQTVTTAAQAYVLKRGVCQDISHIFIAAARSVGIPARYIGGHFWRADGVTQQEAGHAWAEAFVPDLGWVGFDPTNGICPTDQHVRVAVGLDYLGAAPVRGTRYGGGPETMTVEVRIDQQTQQAQS